MDIAAEAIAYLTTATGVPWYHDRPEHATGELGTLTRDGGPTEVGRDRPTMTLMCYAPTRGRAANLAWATKCALLEMQWDVTNVFACEVMGDYYDPVDGYHRHRITAQITTD